MKEISDEKKIEIGEKWAAILMLRKDKDYKDRYQTTWGNKTALGIYYTITSLVETIEENL